MSFFYDLNKKLNSIGNEQEQIAKEVAKAANKSPVRKSLEESLRSDMKALMEDGTGGMNFSGSGSLEEKAGYSAKKAAAGKDIGKPGKNFAKIEKSAAKKYGSKEAGARVAGAVLNKLRTKESQLNEIFMRGGDDIASAVFNLNIFNDLIGENALTTDPEWKQSPAWMAVVKEFKPLALLLLSEIRAKKNTTLSDEDAEELDSLVYDGSDAYESPDMGADWLSGAYRRQAEALEQILNNLKEDGMECNTPTPSKGIPGNIPVPGKMDRLKGKRDYYETDDSEEDIMDYLNRKLAPHDKEQAKEDAISKPYNGSAGDADAYNGMQFEGASTFTPQDIQAAIDYENPVGHIYKIANGKIRFNLMNMDRAALNKILSRPLESQQDWDALKKQMKQALASQLTAEGNAFTGKLKSTPNGGKFTVGGEEYTDTSELDETMTRQHFQHTADLLKHIEDPAKRMELAKHHAGIFKASNPRFDHGKFMKACNCDEGIAGQAVGTLAGGALGGPVGAAIGGAIGNNLTGDGAVEEGFADMDRWLAQREKEKGTGKFDKRKVSTGTVYTRRFDDEPNDDDTDAPVSKGGNPAVKRGRGRPAGTKGATGARGPTGKSKLMAKDAMREEEVDEVCHHCGQAIQEKAVSKKQQKFMGMVHSAQKGEKPASKEVAKVAKGMKKKDAEDFASTKHKGLPEKVKSKKTEEGKGDGNLANNAKPYDKVTQGDVVAGRLGKDEEGGKKKVKKEEKVDETTTSGSVATASEAPKSSKGGMKFGGGIYDSWNRQYETLLAENVNVNTTATKNDDGQDHESITVTVDGDDVSRFKELLQSMGVTQNHNHGSETHSAEPCGTCGGVPCQCDELAEADAPVSQNEPDYPTNQEESDDALQYSGGLDGPKSTGQTTIPVVASQENRLHTMEESTDSFLSLYKAFKTK
jgi:hypothetical protein